MRYRVTVSDGFTTLVRWFERFGDANREAMRIAADLGAATVALDSSSRILASYERAPSGAVRVA